MSTLAPDPAHPPASGAPGALAAGTRFAEFEVEHVLAVDDVGIAYVARDRSHDREVVLDEYLPRALAQRANGRDVVLRDAGAGAAYQAGLRAFVDEARLLARLEHPSLARVERFWEDRGTAYRVTRDARGIDLRDLRRSMPYPPDEPWLRSLVGPLLGALDRLHREGVVHGAIASTHIVIPADGPPLLLGFDAARRVLAEHAGVPESTLSAGFAAPEQYGGHAQARGLGPWTDLYALGAVLHALLFGVAPAPAPTRARRPDSQGIGARIVAGVSPRFVEAVAWMLEVRPERRPPNVAALRAVLDGVAEVPLDDAATVVAADARDVAADAATTEPDAPAAAAPSLRRTADADLRATTPGGADHPPAAEPRHVRRWLSLPLTPLVAVLILGLATLVGALAIALLNAAEERAFAKREVAASGVVVTTVPARRGVAPRPEASGAASRATERHPPARAAR
ncbi:serine/threonine protein kinase [Piscinibacter koreensis]|uniref:serine/threonine protein kinase n=1 Tax=Piscinibacter koreensis TaxID=2742824 RepID=UPI001FE4AC6F|nr:hypothetical protein [Schlegelella koreensis]